MMRPLLLRTTRGLRHFLMPMLRSVMPSMLRSFRVPRRCKTSLTIFKQTTFKPRSTRGMPCVGVQQPHQYRITEHAELLDKLDDAGDGDGVAYGEQLHISFDSGEPPYAFYHTGVGNTWRTVSSVLTPIVLAIYIKEAENEAS